MRQVIKVRKCNRKKTELWFYLVFVGVLLFASKAHAPNLLRLLQTIPLPAIEGRIDHIEIDQARKGGIA
jgi:hypothetical protein